MGGRVDASFTDAVRPFADVKSLSGLFSGDK